MYNRETDQSLNISNLDQIPSHFDEIEVLPNFKKSKSIVESTL